jgi:PPK2 family polyphosphate:nucleotide phosphotransferase
MFKIREIEKKFKVKPRSHVRLKDYDPDWIGSGTTSQQDEQSLKNFSNQLLQESQRQLSEAQARLYAQDTYAVLVILQAIDAAGKDSTIKHVFTGVNPEGCKVVSFKRPSDEELDHDFLWRCNKTLPERGQIGIFNRSQYEEVLVARVHPEILNYQRLPPGKRGKVFWKERYEDINAFEKHLSRNGTIITKFFLHISKEEQKDRFLARIDDPTKKWKFSPSDLDERELWKKYRKAFVMMISATSTSWAPWYIIPANHKWIAQTLVAQILTETILKLELNFPKLSDKANNELMVIRQQLESE